MMKQLTILVIAALAAATGFAHADDFGPRFADQVPVAFGETNTQEPLDMVDIQALQDIEPAAGNEEGYRVRSSDSESNRLIRVYPSNDVDTGDYHLSP